MTSRSILFYSILFWSEILQMMIFGFMGKKKKFKLLCVLIWFTAEVKHCMVQHQHRLKMKEWKIKLAAVSFPSSGKICSGKYSANKGKTTRLMHLIIMASSFISAPKQLFSPLLPQLQGNFSYQDPQFLYLLSVFAQTQMTQRQCLVLGTESFSIHLPQSFPSALCHYQLLTSEIWTKKFLKAEVKFWKRNYWRREFILLTDKYFKN